jgi:flagellar biosynthesis/type III secretory pathway protein FliH
VLTPEQIEHFHLPSSVDKPGSVELDALEALHPGALEKIIRDAAEPYLNGIEDGLAEARNEAREIVSAGWSNLIEPHKQTLHEVQKGVKAITKKYEKRAADLNRRLSRDLAKFRKPLEKLKSAVAQASDSFDPDLPERPAQAQSAQDEAAWLFDSSRSYLDQLDFYKRR